jgi:hypothetical protein
MANRSVTKSLAMQPGRKITAVGADGVRPTHYQIQSGHFVVPFPFYEANKDAIPWNVGFDVVAFGAEYHGKTIDQDRRLYVRLRSHVVPGDVLTLTVRSDVLH